jgi:hypothetical protein
MNNGRITKILLVLFSLFFGILALRWIGPSAAISEMDDILIIKLFGFPSIIISSGLAIWIAFLGYRKAFLFSGFVNTWSAIAALVGCSNGILDIFKFQNKVYEGHQGNNYRSIDLFIIAIIPVLFVALSWLIYYYKRPLKMKAKLI